MRGMILEDDTHLMQQLCGHLERLGLEVLAARTVKDGLELCEQQQFELAVLDRQLPDGDGLEVGEALRALQPQVRMLVLSRVASPQDRVVGLSLCADDYLPKPFLPKELELRLQLLLASTRRVDNRLVRRDGVCLDPSTGWLEVRGREVGRLRRRESQVLACFLQHAPLCLSHEQLLTWVWAEDPDRPQPEHVAVYINRLRAVLGEAAHHLHTIRGFGYAWK